MYTEADTRAVNRGIRRAALALAVAAAAALGVYAAALALRLQALAYAAGALLFAVPAFIGLYYLAPRLRYRRFLADIRQGLITEMTGRVAAIEATPQTQDGARVLPLRLFLEDRQDERIVYLNAGRRQGFPGPGKRVRLKLCGRHIVDWEDGEAPEERITS